MSSTSKVFEVREVVNRGGQIIDLRKLDAKGKFQRFSWRTGSRGELSARFAMRRVTPYAEQGHELDERSTVWLLIEWRDGEADPARYYFSSLPEGMSLDSLVAITTQRWRTERTYQDLKGELGLDHYEGRKFRGWHHHISVVLCCYAFAVAERHRIFPCRAEGLVEVTRSEKRPEFHFADFFITVRLAIARATARWLPRCPFCHRDEPQRRRRRDELPGGRR